MRERARRFASTIGGLVILGIATPGTFAGVSPSAQGAPVSGGNVTVSVFRDYNANGTKDATGTGEPGLGAVKVVASCVTDTGADGVVGTPDDTRVSSSGVTDAAGALTLAVSGSPCRLEASPDATMPAALAAALRPGAAGKTNVQFVNAGDSALFSFNIPTDFCQTRAKLAMNCFTFADNSAASRSAGGNLHVFDEDATAISITADSRATAGQIGSTWGLAYQRSSKTVFSAAYLKAHTSYGSGGAYAIYKASPTTPASGALFVDVNAIGGGGTADTRVGMVTDVDWAKDYTSLDRVGKFGLGGMTVGEDDKTLWVVNMTTRSLVKMDIGNGTAPVVPTAATPIAIPQTQCTSVLGAARPFAVTAKDGALWVGGVCEGTITPLQKPTAWVLRYDLTTNAFDAAPVLTQAMDYDRGCAVYSLVTSCRPAAGAPSIGNRATYTAWRTDYSTYQLGSELGAAITAENETQPMLTGITFINGDMVIAFRNRDVFGSYSLNNQANTAQTHYLWPAGEVLRACSTNGTTWQVETAAAGPCPGSFSRAAGGDQDPGPGGREFYVGDGLNAIHNETIAGGVVQVPGHANLQTSMNDPLAACSAGFASLNNANGSRAASATLYSDNCNTSLQSRFGKANGIGDIEALCDEAPLEIGNRVWKDLDNNGVQDAGEPPVVGVMVNLYENGVAVGMATTDANGLYLFGGAGNINMTGSAPLKKNTAYSVRLDKRADYLPGGALYGTKLTKTDVGANATDTIDNDATLIDSPPGSPAGFTWPTINYTTGGAGENNHTLDFGFCECYSLGNRVFIDTNKSGDQNGTEPGVDGVTVQVFAADASGNPTGPVVATETTKDGGYYRFDCLAPGKYVVVIPASNFAAGQPLAGQVSTSGAKQEASPETGGDRNDNGIDGAAGADVRSGVVMLGPSTMPEPTGETDVQPLRPEVVADGSSNLTVDFGFVPAPVVATTTTTTPVVVVIPPVPQPTTPTVAPTTVAATTVPAASTTAVPTTAPAPSSTTTTVPKACHKVSGVVWVDTNRDGVQDPDEAFIADAQVTITSSSGAVITVTTNASGEYSTDCVENGDYTVTVGAPVKPGAKPTNGTAARAITVNNGPATADFGYIETQVDGLQLDNVAFTGPADNIGRLIAMAFGMILIGSSFMSFQRKPKRA